MQLKLTKPSVVQTLLRQHNLRPSKGLGQNFLINEHYLAQIVAAAELSPADLVIEIGPGLGTLTQALASQAGRVISIEKDQRLAPVLAISLAAHKQVQLVWQDALTVDYQQLVGEATQPKVVANLPYYITTPLILRLLQAEVPWRCLVFLVQAEVADRMQASPSNKDYGLLSVACQYKHEVEIVTRVPASAFYPAPTVASTVVKLQAPASGRPRELAVEEPWFWQVVRAAFGQRRKTLANSLSAGLPLTKEQIQLGLVAQGVEPGARGEDLTVDELVGVANELGCRR